MSLFLSVSLRTRNKLYHSRVLLLSALLPVSENTDSMSVLKITSTRETSRCETKCPAQLRTRSYKYRGCFLESMEASSQTSFQKVKHISRHSNVHQYIYKGNVVQESKFRNRQTWARILTLLLSNWEKQTQSVTFLSPYLLKVRVTTTFQGC